MTKNRQPPSFEQPYTTEMDKSDSNISTPTEPPKPKKKRGRPPGSLQKTHLQKKQKAASSPGSTLGDRRLFRHAQFEPLNLHTQLLQSLVDVFQKLVAVLESMDKNGNGDQDDAVNSPIKVPGYPGKAKHRPQSMGEHGPDPIDLTSGNETLSPQYGVGEPGFVNSAVKAADLKTTTQLFENIVRRVISATANPIDEKETDFAVGLTGTREAVNTGFPICMSTQAALHALDEARAGSSLNSGGEYVPADGRDAFKGEMGRLPVPVRRLTDISFWPLQYSTPPRLCEPLRAIASGIAVYLESTYSASDFSQVTTVAVFHFLFDSYHLDFEELGL